MQLPHSLKEASLPSKWRPSLKTTTEDKVETNRLGAVQPPWMNLHHSSSSLANGTLQERRQKNSKSQSNSESVMKQYLLKMAAQTRLEPYC